MDYRQFYDLESYLFGTVQQRFATSGSLNAFDFFCIVIWKSNRNKSRVARRLLAGEHGDLDSAVRTLTRDLSRRRTNEDRFRCLWHDWRIRRLPMVSAILTVLYPDQFTVYDKRVCDILGRHHGIGDRGNTERIWDAYSAFIRDVRRRARRIPELREKDKWLWGRSFSRQLRQDIDSKFGVHE